MIPIYKPYLPPSSLAYVHEALDSTWISSQGKYIAMVKEKLQELLGIKYVQLLNNGTSACHLMAKVLHRKYGINHIICGDNLYVAAWNAFLFDDNYELSAIETNLNTWNFDLGVLDNVIKKDQGAAVLVVHNIGNVINVPTLKQKYPNTIFVEDACEGFLGTYNGKQVGTESFCSAISFFGNKILTSGEGGAFITNDEDAYLLAKCIQGQGQSSKRFIHTELGYNYRMSNIQAAILYGQVSIVSEILEMKHNVFEFYRNALKDREDILMQTIENGTVPADWMFGVRIPGNPGYEQVEAFFKFHDVEVRPMFYPINAHRYLAGKVGMANCKNAEILNKECVILPSFPELNHNEQKYVLDVLEKYIKNK
jgi:perosamine synthetase